MYVGLFCMSRSMRLGDDRTRRKNQSKPIGLCSWIIRALLIEFKALCKALLMECMSLFHELTKVESISDWIQVSFDGIQGSFLFSWDIRALLMEYKGFLDGIYRL